MLKKVSVSTLTNCFESKYIYFACNYSGCQVHSSRFTVGRLVLLIFTVNFSSRFTPACATADRCQLPSLNIFKMFNFNRSLTLNREPLNCEPD